MDLGKDSGNCPTTISKTGYPFWRRFSTVFFFCLSLAISQARAIVTDVYPIDIQSGSLHRALITLGQQTQASIIFPSTVIDDPDNTQVQGEFSVLQALQQLIEGRDMEYRVVGPQTLVVLPRCHAARECRSASDQLALSMQQDPMIEELFIRGRSVTGSRFKQLDANAFTPVKIITAAEIRLIGAQTMAELMRLLPEVSGNPISTAVSNGGNGSASVTLRGLPATNTLVLINGQRTAHNGLNGSSVDLNSIPLAVVNRIEILKHSGSSLYGSDAIAGVVNVIMKKRFDGALVNAFYGMAAEGDNETRRYDFIGGFHFDRLGLMVAASHYSQDGVFSRDRELSSTADGRPREGVDRRSSATGNARINVDGNILVLAADNLEGTSAADFRQATNEDLFDGQQFKSSLIPAERNSLYIAGEFKKLGSLDAAFDLTYVNSSTLITFAPASVFTAFGNTPISIASSNRYNPFGRDLTDVRIRLLGLGPRLQTNDAQTWRANGRLMGNVRDGEWQLSINWSQTDAQERWQNLANTQNISRGLGADVSCLEDCVPINFFAPAVSMAQDQLNFIRAGATNRGQSELMSVNLDFSQLVDILPAGDVEFASGLEFRHESLNTETDLLLANNQLAGGDFASSTGRRDSTELYLESLLPLAKGARGIYKLEADVSFRMTHSNNVGLRANPKLALRFRPVGDLMLRASLSTGFRSPSLSELHRADSQSQGSFIEPCSVIDDIDDLSGCPMATDPLRNQFIRIARGNKNLRPEKSRNLSLGFIFTPGGLENFTLGLDFYRIYVDQVIGTSGQFALDQNAQFGLFPDRIMRDADGELMAVVASDENLGSRKIHGIDIDISWRLFIAKWGTLGVNLGGAYIHSYRFQYSSNSAQVDLVGTFKDAAAEGSGSIPRWKSNLNLLWQFGRWELGLSSSHVSSVTEQILVQERSRDAGAWSREDVQLSYQFNSGESLVTLGIENFLDEQPPFLGSALNDNFDVRSQDISGRFLYARLSHRL
jgi:iron complex outermembrane receptor protein